MRLPLNFLSESRRIEQQISWGNELLPDYAVQTPFGSLKLHCMNSRVLSNLILLTHLMTSCIVFMESYIGESQDICYLKHTPSSAYASKEVILWGRQCLF